MLESADAGLLLLAEGAQQPIHVADQGLALWGELASPRTVAELAESLAPDEPSERIWGQIHSVLVSLASLRVCEVWSDGGQPSAEGLG